MQINQQPKMKMNNEKGITVKRVIKDMVSKRSQIDVNQPLDPNMIQVNPNMRQLVNEMSDTVGPAEVNLFDQPGGPHGQT